MTSRLRTRSFLWGIILAFFVLGGAACVKSQDGENDHPGTRFDRTSFIAELKRTGHAVETKGPVIQPFLSIQGQFVSINGGDVQTFDYESEKAAKAAVAKVSPDGSTVGNTLIGWVEPPHFFRKGKLLVLYVGSSQQVIRTLESILGSQIAGA